MSEPTSGANQVPLPSSDHDFAAEDPHGRQATPEPSGDRQLTAISGPTTLDKLRGLPWSIAGNSFNTVFAQFTFFGSVFVLFLDTLGLSKSQIGGMLSLLPFAGVLSLFVAPTVARMGYKRTFLTVFGTRKIVTASLLLTPWIVATFGLTTTQYYVTVVVALFAILRALVEISHMPWVQEYVPNSVRGKYSAKDNMFVTVVGIGAIAVAGLVINYTTGLTGYMALIGVGVLAGFIALWCYSFIPGGAPTHTSSAGNSLWRELVESLRDRDYRRYLIGVTLITLGTVSVAAFLPLYLQEQVGIPKGQVVWVQIGTLVGALLSSYVWGWAADRYGSNPVMRTGAIILAVLPLFWWLMPRHTSYSLYLALGIALLQGIANLGWVIGAGRLLHVSLVPPAKKVGYLALYTAWIGIVGGVSQLAGGRLLDMTQGLSVQRAFLAIDPYTPLFVIGTVLAALSFPVLKGITAEASVGTREFAGIFFRGNPFMAMNSLIRIQLARDERTTVLRTGQLGQAGSRLTVEELLDALSDPRFTVRYEATVTISRMRRDPRLTQAMIDLLEGTELALSSQAAWALGRIGDERAVEPLRKAIDSPYRSIQAQSIRALGALGDNASSPLLLERLRRSETDIGLQIAYASALGKLGAVEALDDLLFVLDRTQNSGARMELALSLARLVGKEHNFIRLLHQMRNDAGTSAALTLTDFRRRLERRSRQKADVDQALVSVDDCTKAYARDDMAEGTTALTALLAILPSELYEDVPYRLLLECRERLVEYGPERVEYIVLVLHTLTAGLQSK